MPINWILGHKPQHIREVIWAMSFNSLLKPDPYVDVDDVVGL